MLHASLLALSLGTLPVPELSAMAQPEWVPEENAPALRGPPPAAWVGLAVGGVAGAAVGVATCERGGWAIVCPNPILGALGGGLLGFLVGFVIDHHPPMSAQTSGFLPEARSRDGGPRGMPGGRLPVGITF